MTGDSFSSQHSANVHFGLGASQEIESLKVTWADGTEQAIENPVAGRYFDLGKANNNIDEAGAE